MDQRFAGKEQERKERLLWGSILPVAAAVLTAVLFALILKGIFFPKDRQEKQPEQEISGSLTLPEPPANPYTVSDFSRDGQFVRCAGAQTWVGIDVSSHQKEIDWEQVAREGVQYAIIRVGYRGYDKGGLYMDSTWETNAQGALAAGIPIGVYFYSQAISVDEAVDEAEFVLDALKGYSITYPVVFDWECIGPEARTFNVTSSTVTACTAAFCEKMKDAGYTPAFYFNQSMAGNTFHLRELQDYDFWLAQYSDAMTFQYDVQMWQYTETAQINGVTVPVDLNLSFRNYEAAR